MSGRLTLGGPRSPFAPPVSPGVGVAAGLLIGLSSAPQVQLSQRIFHESPVPGSASYSLGVVLPVLMCFVLFGSSWPQLVRTPPPRSLAVVAAGLAAWTIASSFWSPVPGPTASEALLVAGVLAGGIWFGRVLGPLDQLTALAIATQGLVIVSLIMGSLSPLGRGLGGWNGVFGSRNTLGPVALLALLTCILFAVCVRLDLRSATVLTVLATVDVLAAVLAGARTPLLALLGASAAVGAARLVTRRVQPGAPVSMLSAAWPVGVIGTLSIALVAVGLGSKRLDGALSERPAVWRTAVDAASTAPIEGLGYRALWVDKGYLDPLYIETGLVFDNAHNSVLELYAGGGLVGAACVVVLLVLAIARPWRLLNQGRTIDVVWVGVGTFVVLENLTEAFVVYHSMFWMLVVAAGAVAAPTVRRRS